MALFRVKAGKHSVGRGDDRKIYGKGCPDGVLVESKKDLARWDPMKFEYATTSKRAAGVRLPEPEEPSDSPEDDEMAEPLEDGEDGVDYSSLTNSQLRVECKREGLPVSGSRAVLIQRLENARGVADDGDDDGEDDEDDEDDDEDDGE